MATTGTNDPGHPSAVRSALAAAVVACLAAAPVHAEFAPQISAGISHTDNVALDAENEDTELIYSLEPSFHFAKEASRLLVGVDYRLQALRYRDLADTELFHQYDASLRAELVTDSLFFETGAGRSQAIVDPDQRIPLSNLPISPNRQDRDEYYAGPTFQHAFGSTVVAAAQYRHTWLEYSETEGNQQGDGHFSIDNYRAAEGLTWALRYDWQRADYELGIPWEYQRAGGELGYWVGTNTRVFAGGGKESAWDEPLRPKLQDGFWEAGFSHRIGERLNAEFAAGERSFGNSWRGRFDLQLRHGSTSLSYAETPTTEGQMRFARRAFDAPVVPDDFLTTPGSTERFISKRLQWTLNVELRRTTLSLFLFDADRTDRTEADGTPLGDESHRGYSLHASYRVGPRTTLSIGGAWMEREFREGDVRELIRADFRADYRLGERTTLSLGYDYAEEDGESAEDTLREYVANIASLFVTRTF